MQTDPPSWPEARKRLEEALENARVEIEPNRLWFDGYPLLSPSDLRAALDRIDALEAALKEIVEIGTRVDMKRVRGKISTATLRSPEAQIARAALSPSPTQERVK